MCFIFWGNLGQLQTHLFSFSPQFYIRSWKKINICTDLVPISLKKLNLSKKISYSKEQTIRKDFSTSLSHHGKKFLIIGKSTLIIFNIFSYLTKKLALNKTFIWETKVSQIHFSSIEMHIIY